MKTVTTRWFIRTAIENYYAIDDTSNANTFIATPVKSARDGMYMAPQPVTFNCPYILEQRKAQINVRSIETIGAAFSITMLPA